jgi:hypothetical protein
LSLSASASSKRDASPGSTRDTEQVTLLRYLDVALLIVAAPILILIGVPASGYLIATGAWIVLRLVGVAIDRAAPLGGPVSREVTFRLSYLMGRLFILAIVVILVRKDAGRDAGLTALVVIVFAFTLQLLLSVGNRPQRPARISGAAKATSATPAKAATPAADATPATNATPPADATPARDDTPSDPTPPRSEP